VPVRSCCSENFMCRRVHINDVMLHEIKSLREIFESDGDLSISTIGRIGLNKIVDDDFILSDIVRNPGNPPRCEAFLRAGPRSKCHFNPKDVRAAIVTCGGLCPGLNNVIREIVHTLVYLYGVQNPIIGVRLELTCI
jgi:hypothetical protein